MKKILLILVALLASTPAWCDINYTFTTTTVEGKTLYCRLNDNASGAIIVCPNWTGTYSQGYDGYTKPTGAITIPASVTYNGLQYTVVEIRSAAFYGCNGLTSVTIPNTCGKPCTPL